MEFTNWPFTAARPRWILTTLPFSARASASTKERTQHTESFAVVNPKGTELDIQMKN